MPEITAKEIVKRIRKQLEESGWESALYLHLSSSTFEGIIENLIKLKVDGKRFVPKVQNIMRFLQETPYEKVKCAILVDVPNNQIDSNEGIPMHSTRTIVLKNKEEYTLPTTPQRKFFYPLYGDKISYNKDITHWCSQGVLMIPTAPSSELLGKEHIKLWEPFISYLVDHLNHNKTNIPYVLVNKQAQAYRDIIRSSHQIELTAMPGKEHEDKDWPSWVNRILRMQNKEEIKW